MEITDGAITEEVRSSLKNWSHGRRRGLDEIHQTIVKPLSEVLVKPYKQHFDGSLDEGRFPADWLTLTTIPMHKGDDRDNCSSYAPVTLTSSMRKTLGRAHRNRTVNHPVANRLMMVELHGFWHKRSCLINLISNN